MGCGDPVRSGDPMSIGNPLGRNGSRGRRCSSLHSAGALGNTAANGERSVCDGRSSLRRALESRRLLGDGAGLAAKHPACDMACGKCMGRGRSKHDQTKSFPEQD